MAVLYTKFFHGWSMRLVCIFIFIRPLFCSHTPPVLPQSDPLKIMKDHCPSFKTCDDDGMYYDIVNTSIIFDGCCIHCDCSDACFLKGNCCPGKERRNVTTSGECVQTFLDDQREKSFYRTATFQQSSFILQTSNLQRCDEEILAKCITPNTSSIIEMSPATSNHINYRNAFCAYCDGHQSADTRSWPARVSCTQGFGSNNVLKRNGERDFQMLEHISSTNCQIFWDPIYLEETEPCIHENDIISTCNPYFSFDGTGFARENCQSIDSNGSLTFPVVQGSSIYKNVFCAYCNFAPISQAENLAVNCTMSSSTGAEPNPMQRSLFITMLDTTTYYMPESPTHCSDYQMVIFSVLHRCQ